MADIKILTDQMINKIAAGEVVERPASVVKELVENSIDAGATAITIEINNGGKDLIKITDNGCGIERDFVEVAFLRHATSKIENIDDLRNVMTMGFRGEALSSIASVSSVELVTKTKNDELGYKIELEGGKVTNKEEVAALHGTSFKIKNLFFNVPARLKFLKKTSSESSAVTDLINKFALGNPNVSFKYINNATTLLDTSGDGDLKKVIFNIYGRNVAKALIDLDYKDKLIKLTGYVCKGEEYRSNRGYCNFYINGRYVKSDILQKAVEDGYKGKLPIGKFPIYVIKMEIDPEEVDVNVHPTKLEVRFRDEDFVYESVYGAIITLFKENILIPKASFENKKDTIQKNKFTPFEVDESLVNIIDLTEEKIVEPVKIFEDVEVEKKEELDINWDKMSFKEALKSPIEEEKSQSLSKIIYAEDKNIEKTHKQVVTEEKRDNIIEIKKEERKFFKNYHIIGQIFDTYWLLESDGTSYIIDQHSAHEKIMYEELMKKFKNDEVSSQTLLMPISIVLNEEEVEVLNNNMDLFNRFGFDIEVFGKDTFAIRGVPYVFNAINNASFFMEILENIKLVGNTYDNIHEAFSEKIISMSCKAAVKANDKLSVEDAKVLIEQLISLENPFNCPHGRPTIIELSKYEIEKLFKRKL